ncbi:MAG TPA: hypothetical protein VGF84_10540 [Micromonosporaceae bacterium]
MDMDLQQAALTCARSVYGDVGLVAWVPLAERKRATIARMALLTDAGARTVVAKSGAVRERAALEVLTEAGVEGVPRLLAVHDDPPLILMEDLGAGPSLADRLLGDDRPAAVAAVEAWAVAVARLQTATTALGPAFRERLAALDPAAATDQTPLVIAEAIDDFARLMPELDVVFDDDAAGDLHAIGERLRVDPEAVAGPGAMTPGDACPDNNIETGNGLVLIDLEWAEFRHVAWEAAYLAVPWPTCWCSWRMPPEVTAAAIGRWRDALAPHLTDGSGLDDAVRDATVAWSLMTATWLLPAALGHEPADGGPRPAPRPTVQNRLAVAAEVAADGPLRRFAVDLLAATGRAWGDQPLPLGPAWR